MITETERTYFYSGLTSAKKYGLEWEFITFYKNDRKNGATIKAATFYAVCEWDL